MAFSRSMRSLPRRDPWMLDHPPLSLKSVSTSTMVLISRPFLLQSVHSGVYLVKRSTAQHAGAAACVMLSHALICMLFMWQVLLILSWTALTCWIISRPISPRRLEQM